MRFESDLLRRYSPPLEGKALRPADVDHLYFDGRHYDRLWEFEEDLPFWIRQAEKHGGPVLELACGTARVALALAKEGFQVTGVDLSDSMLAEAHRKCAEEQLFVEFVQADIRSFNLARRFPLVILPANVLCHLLDLEDLEAFLNCVEHHLHDEGTFIIDVFTPRLDILLRNPDTRFPHTEYPDPDGKGKVRVSESNCYNSASQINHVKLHYDLPDRPDQLVEELAMRMYFPQELDALLGYNGFRIEKKYGDYDHTPFGTCTERQLIVCRKRVRA